MINPVSGGSMYGLVTQHYANKFTIPSQSKGEEAGSSYDPEKLKKAMEWSSAKQQLNEINHDLYKRAFEVRSKRSDALNAGVSNTVNAKVTSSDSSVSASATSSAIEGDFDITVEQLKRAHVVKSDSFSSSTQALNKSGNFEINGVTFSMTKDMTLVNMRDMININAKNANVTASISETNELILTSNTLGVTGAINVNDLTSTTSVFSSSNTSVASAQTRLNADDWSHKVAVQSLAYTETINRQYATDFSLGWDREKVANGGTSTWQWNQTADKSLQFIEKTATGRATVRLSETADWVGARTIEADLNLGGSNGNAGLYITYENFDNYTKGYINTSTNKLIIEKKIAGVVVSTVETNYDSAPDVSYKVRGEYDGNGNFAFSLLNTNNTQLAKVSATGWTDAYTKGASFVEIHNTSGGRIESINTYGTSETLHQANYTVDGVAYKSNTNEGINIGGNATINLVGTGTTVVENKTSNAVLKEMGVVNSAGTSFKNEVQTAADTIYSINGGQKVQATNDTVSYNGVDLKLNAAANTPVRISVTREEDKAESANYAEKYNNIVDFVAQYNTASLFSKNNEYVTKNYTDAIKNLARASSISLNSVGISIKSDGTLSIDASKLKDAIENKSSTIRSLFTSTTGLAYKTMTLSSAVLRNDTQFLVDPKQFAQETVSNNYY